MRSMYEYRYCLLIKGCICGIDVLYIRMVKSINIKWSNRLMIAEINYIQCYKIKEVLCFHL